MAATSSSSAPATTTRKCLDEAIAALSTPYNVANLIKECAVDDGVDDPPVPDRAVAQAIKKLNSNLRASLRTTLGRNAQRVVLEQLTTLEQDKANAAVDGRELANSAVTSDDLLRVLPDKWPSKASGTSTARRKYTALRASLATKQSRLHKLRQRRQRAVWTLQACKTMASAVSSDTTATVHAEVETTQQLMREALHKLQAQRK